MNNYFRRLLSMIVAMTMCISSLSIPVGAETSASTFFGSNEVLSGSGITVSGFSTNPIDTDSTFEPDKDLDIGSYGIPALVDGYYMMNNIALLGGSESRASIDQSLIGASDYEDGSSFNYAARLLDPSSDDGAFIAFSTERAAYIKVYAVPMTAGSTLGIMEGNPTKTVEGESDFMDSSDAYAVSESANIPEIYEFTVTKGGQYSIAATAAYDINRVDVLPLSDNDLLVSAEVENVKTAYASTNTASTYANTGDFTYYASDFYSGSTGDTKKSITAPDDRFTFPQTNSWAYNVYKNRSSTVTNDTDLTFSYELMSGGASREIKFTTTEAGTIHFYGYATTNSIVAGDTTYNTAKDETYYNQVIDMSKTLAANESFSVTFDTNGVFLGAKFVAGSDTTTTIDQPFTIAEGSESQTITLTSGSNTYTIDSSTTSPITLASGTYSVTVPSGYTVTPTSFTASTTSVKFNVTAAAAATASATFADMANGTATIDGVTAENGVYTLTQGTAYTITATPSDGYELDSITATGATVDGNKITPTAETVVITVTFKETTSDGGTWYWAYANSSDGATDTSVFTTFPSGTTNLSDEYKTWTVDGQTKSLTKSSGNLTESDIVVAVPSGVTNATLYLYAQAQGNSRVLTITNNSDSTDKQTFSLTGSSSSKPFETVTFNNLKAGATYTITTSGSYRVSAAGLKVTSSSEGSTEEPTETSTASLNVNVTNNSDVTDLTGLIVKAVIEGETEGVTATANDDNSVYTFASLVVGKTYEFLAEGLTGITAVFNPTSKTIAKTNDDVTLTITSSGSTTEKEYADVAATSTDVDTTTGNGTFTYDFASAAGKYAPTTSSTTSAYASADNGTNYVSYTNDGAVITNGSTIAEVFYLPLYSNISGSKIITVTGNLKISEESNSSGPILKLSTGDLSTGDYKEKGNGISIRHSDGNLLIRTETGSSNTAADSTGTFKYNKDTSYEYTFVINLNSKTATLTVGETTITANIPDDLAASTFTYFQSNTASSKQTTTLGNITYKVEDASTESKTITISLAGVTGASLSDISIKNSAGEEVTVSEEGTATLAYGDYTVTSSKYNITSGSSFTVNATEPTNGTVTVTLAEKSASSDYTVVGTNGTEVVYNFGTGATDGNYKIGADVTTLDKDNSGNILVVGAAAYKDSYVNLKSESDKFSYIKINLENKTRIELTYLSTNTGTGGIYKIDDISTISGKNDVSNLSVIKDANGNSADLSGKTSQTFDLDAGEYYILAKGSTAFSIDRFSLLDISNGSPTQKVTFYVRSMSKNSEGNYVYDQVISSAKITPVDSECNAIEGAESKTVEDDIAYELNQSTWYKVELTDVDASKGYTVLAPHTGVNPMFYVNTNGDPRYIAITFVSDTHTYEYTDFIGEGEVTDDAGLVYTFTGETVHSGKYAHDKANAAANAVYTSAADGTESDTTNAVLFAPTIGLSVINGSKTSYTRAYLPLKKEVNNGKVTITGTVKMTDDGDPNTEPCNIVSFGDGYGVGIRYSNGTLGLWDGSKMTTSGNFEYTMGYDVTFEWVIDIDSNTQSLTIGGKTLTQTFTTAQSSEVVALNTQTGTDFNVRCKNMTIKQVVSEQTFTVNGKVTDANGNGIDGITVTLGDNTAVTSGGGIFTFTGIPVSANTYVITATDPNGTYLNGSCTIPANQEASSTYDAAIQLTANQATTYEAYVWDFDENKSTLPADDTIYANSSGSFNSTTGHLKLETGTSLKVANPVAGTLTISVTKSGTTTAAADGTKVKVDGVEYEVKDGVVTVSLSATNSENPYIVTKASNNGSSLEISKIVFTPAVDSTLGGLAGSVTYVDEDGYSQNVTSGSVYYVACDENGNVSDDANPVGLTIGSDGTFSSGQLLQNGNYYKVYFEETTSYNSAEKVVQIITGKNADASLVLTLKDTTEYTVTINVTNSTGEAFVLGVHNNLDDNGVNVDNINVGSGGDAQAITLSLPNGSYTLFANGLSGTPVYSGDGQTFTVNSADLTHNITVNLNTTTLTPISADTTYNFGSADGSISASNENFNIEDCSASSGYLKLSSSTSYVEFVVGEDEIIQVEFDVDNKNAVLLYPDGSTKTLNKSTNTVLTLGAGTYKIEQSTTKLVSIKTTSVNTYKGSITINNKYTEDVVVTLSNSSAGLSYEVTAPAGTSTQRLSSVVSGDYTITAAKGVVTVGGSTNTSVSIVEDDFTIDDVVITPSNTVTVIFTGMTSSVPVKIDSTSYSSEKKFTGVKTGTSYTIDPSSCKMTGWKVTKTDANGSEVETDANLVFHNSSNTKDRKFTFTVPETAAEGDTYTVTFDNDNASTYFTYYVGGASVNYGQYGFGNDKIRVCGNKVANDAREQLKSVLKYATMADYYSGAYQSNGAGQYESTQIHINSDENDNTAKAVYSIGNQFGILAPNTTHTLDDTHSYVEFTINVSGNVNLKVDSSGGTIVLYKVGEDGTTLTKLSGTEQSSSTKVVYNTNITSGATYRVFNEGSSNAYLKSIRIFNPDNVFFNAYSQAGNSGNNTLNNGTITAQYVSESDVTGALRDKLGIAEGSTNNLFRLIGMVKPDLTNISLSAALNDITAIGWTIVDANTVETYNNTSGLEYYFNPNQNIGGTAVTTKDIRVSEMLNSGVLKMTGFGTAKDSTTIGDDIDTSNGLTSDMLETGTLDRFTSADDITEAYAVRFLRLSEGDDYYAFPYTILYGSDSPGYIEVKRSEVSTAKDALVKMGAVHLTVPSTNS